MTKKELLEWIGGPDDLPIVAVDPTYGTDRTGHPAPVVLRTVADEVPGPPVPPKPDDHRPVG